MNDPIVLTKDCISCWPSIFVWLYFPFFYRPNKQKITDIRSILESIFAMQKNILSALEDVYNK